MEQNAESASPVRETTARTLPTPFLTKTYQLVDDKEFDDVISWNEDGSTFVVWNPSAFATDLLPKYFKHNNFSSFVRQLNTYGFRKVVTDRWEFSNDCFRKGEKRLLHYIQRRKITALSSPVAAAAPAETISPGNSGEEQVISSNSSSAKQRDVSCSGATDLADENELLRKQNAELRRELSRIRNLCGNVYALMSNYAFGCSYPSAESLDLLPTKRCFEGFNGLSHGGKTAEETNSARLFGVTIHPKLSTEGCNGAHSVKQEASDLHQ